MAGRVARGTGARGRPYDHLVPVRPRDLLLLPGPAGPPVVAVPGLGLSADVPGRTLRLLTGAAPGVALALPAYGRPAGRTTPLGPSALAAGLLARLEALDVPRAVLLGHSASCQIVVHAALRAPERVAGLVLVGPTTDPRAAGWPALTARWLRTAAHERPGQVPLLVRDYARSGLATMARGMDVARHDRLDRLLPAVRCPVLVVRGRRDRIAPRDWADALAALARDGRAETLPAGAHMVPITHPAELAARIRAFLPLTRSARQDRAG
jgi:pimeloyl-ACP methyl ester carboxylesterase